MFLLYSCICSCNANSKYTPPPLELPTAWNNYPINKNKEQNLKKNSDWWAQFNDPVLNDIIKESLINNSDIELAMVNIATARARLTLTNSSRFPQLNLQGNAGRTKNSDAIGTTILSGNTNNFGLAGVLNYELDLWGALANASDAARKSLLASEYSKDAVRLSVTSNVAIAYFNLLALDKQIVVTEQLIATQQEIYKLTQKLYIRGVGDLILVSEAASDLAITNSSLPPLKQQRQQQESALKILLGRSPENIVNGFIQRDKTLNLLPTPPVLPEILPSELLEQRPDIKAAEQSLFAASANLKSVKAAYFPNISLTGLLGFNSNNLNTLFNSTAHTWQIGGNIAGSIFDFGKTKANVEIAKGLKEQYVVQYKTTVRQAFSEVMNALSGQQNAANNFRIWQQNEKALTEILKLARYRYKHGNTNYLTVLTAKQNALQNEIDYANIKLQELSAAVNLMHALGGSWYSSKQ